MEAYPLHWPSGFPKSKDKHTSQFKTSLAGALKNVNNSLYMFGKDSKTPITTMIISSNVTLGMQNPKESGVAIWFTWSEANLCIAVDRYQRVEDNLQAIHHIIEARRTELRHGGLHIVRQTFMGFKALPQSTKRDWWVVLGVSQKSTLFEIKAAWKQKLLMVHPDHGGSTQQLDEVQNAYKESINTNRA